MFYATSTSAEPMLSFENITHPVDATSTCNFENSDSTAHCRRRGVWKTTTKMLREGVIRQRLDAEIRDRPACRYWLCAGLHCYT